MKKVSFFKSDKAKSMNHSIFKFSSVILFLSISICGFGQNQDTVNNPNQRAVNYTSDQYWFYNGGGLTNQLRGKQNKTLSWFGDDELFSLEIVPNKSSPDISWTFANTRYGTTIPLLLGEGDIARIIASNILQLSAGGRGLSNANDATDFTISKNGYIGIGTRNPYDKLTVTGGNVSFELPTSSGNPIGVQLRDFWGRNEGSIGTTTNHSFTLYSNNSGRIRLDKEGYVVINGQFNETFNQISQANKSKYSLFILGGALSEDYALGPRNTWSDFVFNKDYELKSLKEVEEFIETNNHLPEIPSAKQVKEEGYSLHDMNIKLLQKVEELTLYVIQLNKDIEELKKEK